MDPAWAAPAACSADTLAVPRTPASSPPSVGRVQIAAPPPAGSSPPRTPLVAPARIVPPASSLRPPLPLHGKWAIAAGFLLRRNRSIRLLREGFSLRRSQRVRGWPFPAARPQWGGLIKRERNSPCRSLSQNYRSWMPLSVPILSPSPR